MSRSVARAVGRIVRRVVTFPLIVAMLVVMVPFTGCTWKGQARSPKSAAAPELSKRVPTASERFSDASDKLTSSLEAASRAFASDSDATTALAGVADFADALPALDRGVRAEFAKTRGILRKIDSPEKDRIERRVERTYAKRVKTLKRHLRAIEQAQGKTETRSAVTSASRWLASITPEEPHQPLGTELPHRIVDRKAGPPVLGASIAPAYAPNTPGSEPSTLPVTPTSEDLTSTVEVQFSPEISSLVTSLGSDPVRIYEYVRNTIDFEPYYGSRKGATETLLEGSGNDIDTASLLIALMRKAGYPARYVQGVVDVPIDRAMNWVGVERPEAAGRLLAANGVGASKLISGGKIAQLRTEHTWAEVYVPYEDYRGRGESQTRRWIPLDASYKQFERAPRPSILRDALPDESTPPTDPASIGALIRRVESATESWAETHTAELVALVGPRKVKEESPGLLPSCLPYKTSVRGERAAQSCVDTVSVTLPGAENVCLPLSAAATSTISIGYRPDDTTVDLVGEYGTLLSVPAYLARMVPVLWVDGRIAAVGDAANLGAPQYVDVQVTSGDAVANASRTLVTGGYYGLTFDAGGVPSARLSKTRADINAAVQAARSGGIDVETIAGPFLAAVGRTYFAQLDFGAEMLARATSVRHVHNPSMLFAGIEVMPHTVLGAPVSASLSGSSLDVRTNSYVVEPESGSAQAKAQFNLACGFLSSALEHDVYEDMLGVSAVSTASVFAEAARTGVEVLRLDAESLATGLEELRADDSFKKYISDVVQAGHIVFVPVHPVPVGAWNGNAWLDIDPETGDSGYMIDSLGGSIVEAIEKWYSTGLGSLVDLTRISFTQVRWMKVWKTNVTGLFTSYEWGPPGWLDDLCNQLSLFVMPLLFAFEQAMADIERTDLSPEQRVGRVLVTWAAFMAEAWVAVSLIMPAAMAVGAWFGPYGPTVFGSVVCAAVGVAFSIMWDMLKDKLFQWGHLGTASRNEPLYLGRPGTAFA